ncbi:MAG: DUF2851 family protein [Cyclobacteriaceae bacterium]
MDEYFLHFLWQYQKFAKLPLQTCNGENITVLKTGFHNHNSGPDFIEAKIKISEIEWAGSVEIHHKSSDWLLHKHQHDQSYENVILHIVWLHDKEIFTPKSKTTIPTLVLSEFVDPNLELAYRAYINQPETILCSKKLPAIPDLKKVMMMDHAVTERLESKAALIRQIYDQTERDWEETAYRILGKNFGFSVNKEPFGKLTTVLPFKIIKKHLDHPTQVFALIFGAAGFLEDTNDAYSRELAQEYAFLNRKYEINSPLQRFHWKFSKLRPANFPTVRLSQFTTLIIKQRGFFSLFIHTEEAAQLRSRLKVSPSGYWADHYDFAKKLETGENHFGQTSVDNILINTAAPLLAAYATSISETKYIERAMEMLATLKPEQNRITREWTKNGIDIESAYHSQALIQQYNEYCVKKKCLHCNIGISILHR